MLREAAAAMRARAEAATDGPWTDGPHFQRASCASVFAGKRTDGHYLAMYATTANAEHMAGMHPAVALAVADMLENARCRLHCDSDGKRLPYCSRCEDSGDDHECPDRTDCAHSADFIHALKVARAYLGRAS